MGVQIPFWISVFVFFRKIPKSEIASSYGSSIFNFLSNLHTVFHSGCTIYIPHNSVQGFPFLHILANTCCLSSLDDSHSDRWYLCGCNLHFPWWMVMLSIFSCVCWPFVCLWKNVYSGPLPIFHLDCLYFWCWIVWVACIFWILTPY